MGSSIPAKQVDPDRLFLYFQKIMDPLVAQDYVLIYVHTNVSSENIPKFGWLRKCYSTFSRQYKKNLKELFVVHPTSLIKSMVKLFKPFVSTKFWKKFHYVAEPKTLCQFVVLGKYKQ
uniref:CRAL-TRIO domain-containing protein n=1 Tax=Arcella intermedia TaxID=1963864 RepID=A0A6B2LRL2_9EUKA